MDEETNIFGALKFIEQLYLDEKIPDFIYRNILREYSEVIDITAFVCDTCKEEKEED